MKDNQEKKKLARGEARQHILEVADNLFYNMGIRAVGVDTIVAQSGVAKTTLYDHFASKDELINAYLVGRDNFFWERIESVLTQHPNQPLQQLADLFEEFQSWLSNPEFIGCPFLSATAEFPELNQPGHQVSLEHKEKLRAKFAQLAQAAGIKTADRLADQLMLLLDGAFAAKRVYRSVESPAQELKASVDILIAAHLAMATI